MSEAEKRLRDWIRSFHPDVYVQAEEDLTAMPSSARDAALEEAARVADSESVSDNRTKIQKAASSRARRIGERIRALQSAPAQVISNTAVKDALLAYYSGAPLCSRRDLLDALAARLGVDLDAATPDGSLDDLCTACRVPKRRHVEHGCHEFQPAARLGADE